MPFVTEEIWRRWDGGESIMLAPWPEPRPEHRDDAAEAGLSFAVDLVTAVRSFRSDHQVPPGRELAVRLHAGERGREVLGLLQEEIRRLARLSSVEVSAKPLDPAGCARLQVQGAEVLVPLAGVLDVDTECERIRGRLEGLAADAERSERKLQNEGFVRKAPAEVVEKQRARLGAIKEEEAALRAQLDELGCA
jgi:valyl-tRNA synthetase